MFRSSRSITLVLITSSLIALGFGLYDCDRGPYSSTQSSTGSHGPRHYWFSRGWSGFSSSHSSSFSSSHASRGGFGSTGHSVSS